MACRIRACARGKWAEEMRGKTGLAWDLYCDPLWEKVQFHANNGFELCMNIAVQVKLQVYPLFGMKGNYDPLPCSYR